ncbi:MAG: DUF3084 domain-containing protein [Cyanobacteria bacterium J06592_8]
MTAGFILVIAILVLGGVIATVSDRLGTKVGKARLSLFKLRPKSTAVLVTMVTGTLLSGLTLTILFTASKPLRRGVFRIDEIQERLNQSRKDLTRTEDEKERAEEELEQAKNSLDEALAQLNQINSSLDQVNTQATETETKLKQTQSQLENSQAKLDQLQSELSQINEAKTQTESELNQTESQLQEVFDQKQSLQSEIEQLQAEQAELIEQREQVKAQIQERDREIAQQDQAIAERDQVIAERETTIAEREQRLEDLEEQQAKLEQQKAYLKEQFQLVERDFQLLREGSVVLKRGAILASGLIRVKDPKKSTEVVNGLLQEANRNAMNSVQLGNYNVEKEQVIQITKAEVEELIKEIDDGRDYVVQVISAANYLAGESRVAVFTKAEPNRLLFSSGEVIAGTSIRPSRLSDDQLQQQLEQLLDASQFRARFVGILDIDGSIQIGDARVETFVNFLEQLQQHNQPVELQAVASEDTYTIGPLKIDLLARHNGEVVLSTRPQDQKQITPEITEDQQQVEKNKPEQQRQRRGRPYQIDRSRSLFREDE